MLIAKDVSKVYGEGPSAVQALDRVTISFDSGMFAAIMGPSGSGKSTLMHCLAGLDTVTSGSVMIGDRELSGLSDRALTLLRRDRVGFIFQSFNLLPALTAEQNITLPLELAGRRPDPRWLREIIARARPRRPAATPARRSCRAGSSSGSPARGR